MCIFWRYRRRKSMKEGVGCLMVNRCVSRASLKKKRLKLHVYLTKAVGKMPMAITFRSSVCIACHVPVRPFGYGATMIDWNEDGHPQHELVEVQFPQRQWGPVQSPSLWQSTPIVGSCICLSNVLISVGPAYKHQWTDWSLKPFLEVHAYGHVSPPVV